ncbi:unnamed protein product [Penicillium salamii]|nr:unnamed protein product [Penicillium salamii]
MASRYTSLKKGIKTRNRSWRSLCLDTWFPEIVATAFSIACFIAICGILISYNQKSRPGLQYGLSLNAIISVLATSCKSSLIFVIGEAMGQLKWSWFHANPNKLVDIQILDSASRGPLGSIATFFQKTRRSLASLGAAVIILLLAFDPFIQQIISYPTRLVAMPNGNAIAKRLEFFAPDMEYDFVYTSGLWSDDTMLSPSCPSGNCTWSKFRSSGMCSQCSDITNSMNIECENMGNISRPIQGTTNETSQLINVTCHLTPPQGNPTQFTQTFYFSSLSESSYKTSGVSWNIFSAWDPNNMSSRLGYTGSRPFTWPGNPLVVVAYVETGYNEDYLHSDFISGIKVEKATECSLELCLLEYEISVENGIPDMITSVLDYGELFWRSRPTPSAPWEKTLCWKPTSGPSDTITFENSDPTKADVELSPVEFAFCGISYKVSIPENVFEGSVIKDYIRRSDGSLESGPPWGDPNTLRIGSVGLDLIMSNVTKHMNKEALQINGSDVHGIALAIEVFVEAQWLWLILPIILVVSGTIFITLVILENRKSGRSLWKSSVLAFFYHGLHNFDNDCMAASVMERKAEELVVQLQASGDHGDLILQEEKS